MSDKQTIGLPLGTRLLRIQRVTDGWRLWLGTRDYVHGNYILLNNDGSAYNTTVRSDEGDATFQVRHRDRETK